VTGSARRGVATVPDATASARVRGMTRAELQWRADENFREMYRDLARGSAHGVVVEREGACLVATGVPVALFNPAFPPASVCDETAKRLDRFLNVTRTFFRRRGLPWALVVPEHEPGRRFGPPGWLLDAGLYPLQTLPVLVHATLPGERWPRPNPRLDIRVSRTPDEVADHRALLEAGFGIPETMSNVVLPTQPATPLLTLYVAYRSDTGVPVGSAALCEGGGVAGVYNVATHPMHRRMGVAATLMRRLLEDARARGLATCVLQSSMEGRPLYARLGFERLSTYSVYGDGAAGQGV